MLVLYGRLTFQPACVFRGLNKGLNCVWTQSRVAQPETSREAARIRLVDHARHSLGNQNQAANNGHRSTKPESS